VTYRTEEPADPLAHFADWYEPALHSEVTPDRNAMTLATATREGRPSARMVLLKSYDARGFVFFTNYESRKGQELAENPFAALVLYWPELRRQIRIEGRVERVSPAESDAYFASRPRGSQIAARASRQSAPIAGRPALEGAVETVSAEFQDHAVPRPEYWGGFRAVPERIEFWEGRRDRLHDRLLYTRLPDGSWSVQQLSP